MTEDLKQQLKTQALAHWKDNLRRLRKMKWTEWQASGIESKRNRLLYDLDDGETLRMGGLACPYCRHYADCQDGFDNCPLYEGGLTGRCCQEWWDVYVAMAWGGKKKDAIEAVEAMIRRIEEC